MVDEKAAYLFTYPVMFDIDNNKELTIQVKKILGDEFERKAKNLCIHASNCGKAWLHYWIDAETKTFKYALVNTEEIIPIYENGLERNLKAIIRHYWCMEEVENELEDKPFFYIEYWTTSTMDKYRFQGTSCMGKLLNDIHISHALKSVPFIEFANNHKKQSDLAKYKDQIDLYNRVLSGYANDLEDIQQIIYILENYGGQDLGEFLSDLKRFKAIKVDTDTISSGGVKTLQIEIPTEARSILLDILKKQIYESGQGLQQDVESVGNASGVALKFFYRKLELKAGLLETEFKTGFNRLIRAILAFLGVSGDVNIIQNYTRNMISNDFENAQIAQASEGIISCKTRIKNHPWVEDVEEELQQLKQEEEEEKKKQDDYFKAFEQQDKNEEINKDVANGEDK